MVYKNSKDGETDMNIKTKISICLILLFVIICTFLPNKIYATDTLSDIMNKSEEFLDKSNEIGINTGNLKETSNFIYNILFTIAVVVAFAVGMIIGIQFITGSVDEKAKIKETLVPYVVGVFVIFGAFTIWKVVTEFGTKLTETSTGTIQSEQEIKKAVDEFFEKNSYLYCPLCGKQMTKDKISFDTGNAGIICNGCISTVKKEDFMTKPLSRNYDAYCAGCFGGLTSINNYEYECQNENCPLKGEKRLKKSPTIKCPSCGDLLTVVVKEGSIERVQCTNPNCTIVDKTLNIKNRVLECPDCQDGFVLKEMSNFGIPSNNYKCSKCSFKMNANNNQVLFEIVKTEYKIISKRTLESNNAPSYNYYNDYAEYIKDYGYIPAKVSGVSKFEMYCPKCEAGIPKKATKDIDWRLQVHMWRTTTSVSCKLLLLNNVINFFLKFLRKSKYK